MIKNNISRIEERYKRKVLFALQTGSKTFNCNNASDEDILYVVNGLDFLSSHIHIDNECLFIMSLGVFEERVNFRFNGTVGAVNSIYCAMTLFAAQNDKSKVLYGELSTQLNLIKYRCEARQAANVFLGFCRTNIDHCPKRMYWAIALIYALQNNGRWFTAEQLDVIQKCHDRELPVEYVDKFLELNELL